VQSVVLQAAGNLHLIAYLDGRTWKMAIIA
jgi:hypothetical protein